MFPVAYRELLAASRRKSTFHVRTIVTGTGLAMCLSMLSATSLVAGASGQQAFHLIAGAAFVFALLSGLWLTADCISEERRDGTLPLLYLTRMGRCELLFSKLLGRSLHSIYGLLALIPVSALAVMAGGVSGREIWQTGVVLVLTIAFSLAAGLLASTLNLAEREVISVAIVFLPCFGWLATTSLTGMLLTLALRQCAKRRDWWTWVPFGIGTSLIMLFDVFEESWFQGSPVHAWMLAARGQLASSPLSPLSICATSAAFLSLAFLAMDWTSAPAESRHSSGVLTSFKSWRARRLRSQLRDRPLNWLLTTQSPGTGLLIASAGASLANTIVFTTAGSAVPSQAWILFWIPGLMFSFAAARQAAAALITLRQEGGLELILTTPVPFQQLLRAQRHIFWRRISILIIAVLGIQSWSHWRAVDFRMHSSNLWLIGSSAAVGALYFVALAELGIWCGMRQKSIWLAAGSTVLIVVILPAVLLSLFAGILLRSASSLAAPVIIPGLQATYYCIVIRFARARLKRMERIFQSWTTSTSGSEPV